ncbi:MAG: polymorphic toxin-type HINT domain-containing protein, partial [Candidatus Micrarchaeaceae archaeon]
MPASEVKIGDIILSYDFATGKLIPSTITYVQTFEANNTYVFNGNLRVDSHEVIYVNGKWIRAKNIKVGDSLYMPGYGNVAVYSIKIYNKGGKVYGFLGSPSNN